MPTKITCPECDTPQTVADDQAGKRIRCKNCKQAMDVPAKEAPTKRGSPEPSKGGLPMLWIALGGGALLVLLLMCAGGGVGGYFLLRSTPGDLAGGQKKGQVKPPIEIKTTMPDGSMALAISPDGKYAIVRGTGAAKNVQIWNLPDKKKLHEFSSPAGSMHQVAISPDGKFAAYGNQDSRHVTLIDMASGKEVKQLRKNKGQLDFITTGLHFSPKSDLLFVASGSNLVGWDLSGNERFGWTNDAEINCLSPLFDGDKKFATGDHKGNVKIWDIDQGKAVKTLSGGHGKEQVKRIAVSADGKTLISMAFDRTFQVWDVAAGTSRPKQLPALTGLWGNLLLTPDGKTIIYNNSSNNILLVDVEAGTMNYELKGHTNMVTGIALTADGGTLVSASRDNTIRVWEIKDLK